MVRTTAEWEVVIGAQVRRARIAADLDQVSFAGRVNVSVGALRNLEGGRGARLSTLIPVVRGLGLEEWLERLYVEPVSPLRLARERALAPARQRVSRRRS